MKLFIAIAAFACSFSVLAQESGFVTRPSKYSVTGAMDRVETALRGVNEVQVFVRV